MLRYQPTGRASCPHGALKEAGDSVSPCLPTGIRVLLLLFNPLPLRFNPRVYFALLLLRPPLVVLVIDYGLTWPT